jgi:hypothetical protein
MFHDVTATVGRTPIVELGRLAKGLAGRVVTKLEFRNPCGSVKDRVGVALEDAERRSARAPLVAEDQGRLLHNDDGSLQNVLPLMSIDGSVLIHEFYATRRMSGLRPAGVTAPASVYLYFFCGQSSVRRLSALYLRF